MRYLFLFLLLPFMATAQDSIPLTNHVYCLVGNELVKPSEDSVAYEQYNGLIPTIWAYKGKTVYYYIDRGVDGKQVTRLCIIYKKRKKWRSKIL
jgi:hypothetical protein